MAKRSRTSVLTLDHDAANADWPKKGTPSVETNRILRMRYSGGIVKHLGLHMYSGAVPAIAELVANAWDADATKVEISIPLGRRIERSSVISVHDNGGGMSFEEINDHYLLVGWNRRRSGERTAGGRRVMGRKGLGKLAGFGIAHRIEVWTVDSAGWLTAFEMNYEDITRDDKASLIETYSPPLLEDRAVLPTDSIQRGTLVRLSDLQLRNAIPADGFRESMARRFGVLSDKFQVVVNGRAIRRQHVPFAIRFPGSGLTHEEVPGAGSVRWWAGFTRKPIVEDYARGIAVLVRGKLAQEPFFFRISQGTEAQLGLEYLSGEVHADFLDEQADLIATDRSSILWEDSAARPLLDWGQKWVRHLLRQWLASRQKESDAELRKRVPSIDRIGRFPLRQRRELSATVKRLTQIPTIEPDRLREIAESLMRVYEGHQYVELISEIGTDAGAPDRLRELIAEWDVMEAVAVSQVVRGRIQLIRALRGVATNASQLLFPFVVNHPWILDLAWQSMARDRRHERLLGKGATKTVVFSAPSRMAVLLSTEEALKSRHDAEEIADRVRRSAQRRGRVLEVIVVTARLSGRLQADGLRVRTWHQLLDEAEAQHEKFLRLTRSRARSDPRIQALPRI